MAFTEKQAKAKAQQIFERFGELIHLACANSVVDDSFLAGFVGVESGIDSHGNIKPDATRFEPGVYQDLISLRDHGYCFVGGRKLTNYSGVRQSQIKDASDEAIRALATSYSFSQIMGWHVINNLHCSIADLRDRNKHFHYTVKLLKIVGGKYLERGDLASVLKIWNTGSANGKTYHLDYVDNALLVKKHYAQILKDNRNAFHQSALAIPQNPASANPKQPQVMAANDISRTPSNPSFGGAVQTSVIAGDQYSGASPALQEPVQASGNAPTSTADGSEQNLAQNNQPNGTGSPDSNSTQATETTATATAQTAQGEIKQEVSKVNEQDVGETVKVDAPLPYNGIGFFATIKRDLTWILGGNVTVQTITEYGQQAQTIVPPSLLTKLAYLIAAASVCYLLFRVVHYAIDSWKQSHKTRLKAEIDSDVKRKNMEWI